MDTLLQQLFNLFVAPPGNVIYYIVLAFSIVTALQAVILSRQANATVFTRRILLGLGLLLATQLVMAVASALVWQGLANPHIVLPPLDRAMTAFGLALLVWLWAAPAPNRLADAALALVFVVLVIAYFLTFNTWSPAAAGIQFSGTSLDWIWEVGMLALSLVGLLILSLTRPPGWPVGIGMLLINLAGHAIQFLSPVPSSDFSGVVRLAQLSSYPLLPVLVQRLAPRREAAAEASALPTPLQLAARPPAGIIQERRRFSADPRAVNGWLQLAIQHQPEKVYAEFGRAYAQTMLSDLCLVARGPDALGQVQILAGYDLIREEYQTPTSVPADKISTIASALLKGRPLRLGGDAPSAPDLDALAAALNLEHTGALMVVPLVAPPQVWGGVILLSPYSTRSWTAEDQTYLMSSIETMVQVLQLAEQPVAPPATASEVPQLPLSPKPQEELTNQLAARLAQIEQENFNLRNELQNLKANRPPDLDSLLAVQKESEEMIGGMQQENERLQAALAVALSAAANPPDPKPSEDLARLAAEMDAAREQISALEQKLAAAERSAQAPQPAPALKAEAEADAAPPVSHEEAEVINALVQEVRQPMASITGYTDLLLAESAGILGALQRKFLERIKSSIERMQAILNDLIHITALQSGPLELVPVAIQAGTLIDEAVAAISSQLREKNTSLQVELPEELPELHADRDALQQIVNHLLQNASSATPAEGTLEIRVHLTQDERGAPALKLEVSDSGGGIDKADLPRVFSRRYRADNPLIQGVGDTGVGLSIARMLVEAQHGKIWVESIPGQGATFRVLLPLNPQEEEVAPKS